MSGSLQHVGDDDAKCVICGVMAVGPCARCHDPVCGDCCVIVDGKAMKFAICLRCERRGGRSIGGPWSSLLVWLGGILLALAAATALLAWLTSRR